MFKVKEKEFVFDAIRYTGDNIPEVEKFVGSTCTVFKNSVASFARIGPSLHPNDWIIRTEFKSKFNHFNQGEFVVLKEHEFHTLYDIEHEKKG